MLIKKSFFVDRLPTMLPKGLDNDWNKRPTVTRVVSSSQDEPTAAPIVKQKSSASLASDGIKCVSVTLLLIFLVMDY